ncbi:MAG TPA: hypothetical protein ENJ87_10250, partial [Gammaproteobacteria bacterium]|nr:hypothetical protein [Gammaproteobacteria bacterium]
MQFANNKFIATLIISNVIAFTVIFILMWMLWSNNGADGKPSSMIETTSVNKAGELSISQNNQEKPSPAVKTVTIVEAITQEVRSTNFKLDELTRSRQTIPKTSRGDDQRDNDKLSDEEYISAFKELKKNKRITANYSEKDITEVKASDKATNVSRKVDNHFNKVDVSQSKKRGRSDKTLAQQVSTIVGKDMTADNKVSGNNFPEKGYLKTLKEEGTERKNEMRTIKVRRGETLWRISLRAYGTG